jgi:hypothetical protein
MIDSAVSPPSRERSAPFQRRLPPGTPFTVATWRRTREPYRILSRRSLQQEVDRARPASAVPPALPPELGCGGRRRGAATVVSARPHAARPACTSARDIAAQPLPDRRRALRRLPGVGRHGRRPPRSLRRDLAPSPTRRVLGRVFLAPGGSPALATASRGPVALRPARARLRLQPGPHGFRRHLVHAAPTALPALPAAPPLRELSHISRRRADPRGPAR